MLTKNLLGAFVGKGGVFNQSSFQEKSQIFYKVEVSIVSSSISKWFEFELAIFPLDNPFFSDARNISLCFLSRWRSLLCSNWWGFTCPGANGSPSPCKNRSSCDPDKLFVISCSIRTMSACGSLLASPKRSKTKPFQSLFVSTHFSRGKNQSNSTSRWFQCSFCLLFNDNFIRDVCFSSNFVSQFGWHVRYSPSYPNHDKSDKVLEQNNVFKYEL